jgi:transposase InsO family protein
MVDPVTSGPIFRFEINTTGVFKQRKVRFIRRADLGYLVEFLPSKEAEAVPAIMRGSRPDVEFTGRKMISHADLTAALLDGTLDIDESDFVFIDHSQTFKPDFVASLDERPAQDLLLRYATGILMREICEEKGITKITRSAVFGIEGEIQKRLQARIDLLNHEVDIRRRHPMRRKMSPKNCATAQWILEWDQRLREKGFCSLVDRRYMSGNTGPRLHPVVADVLADILKEYVTLEKVSVTRLHGLTQRRVEAARAEAKTKLLLRQQNGEIIAEAEWADLNKILPPCEKTVGAWKKRISPLQAILSSNGPEWLLRNQLVTGMGLHVERAGQVLIIDEYDADLMVIVPFEFLLHWLGKAKLDALGIRLDTPLRVKISVIIDAFSGCIAGMQLSMTASSELAKRTIMMSMMDKTKISRACGAEGSWNQSLRAEKIVHDSGNAYLAYVTEPLCAQLRIDKLAAPKAKAYIRGIMERVFRTFHTNLLSIIPGKTFSNTVLRGDYNSEAEAILTLDDLIQVLVVWIVDIYHNTENMGRDGLTPADLWHHEMTMGMGCRPVPSLRTMTHVFGTSLARIAQSTGIRIMHANYFSKEFAQELLRNPKRQFRVRWWEENMSSAEVEIKPRVWLSLEVMDPEARGLCVDEWIQLLQRRHIARNPDAAAIRHRAQDKIDALVNDRIAMRRKVSRKTLDTEQDVHRVEQKLLRYFVTPTTAITTEQTHALYGVPVGDLPALDESGNATPVSTPKVESKIAQAHEDDSITGPRAPSATLGRRRRTTSWTPGMKE